MIGNSTNSDISNFEIRKNTYDPMQLMSNERWEMILKCKNDFLKNEIIDPFYYPYIDPEVAASWTRSRSAGVNPFEPMLGEQLRTEELAKIRDENRLLIDLTQPFFKAFSYLTISSGYHMHLDDKNGVPLLQQGKKFPIDHQKIIPIVCKENSIGTNSHILCLRLKRPVQILGPEHYCIAFQNIVSSAAPILDENQEVLATLSLWTSITPPYDVNLQLLPSFMLGLITTIATAVENKIKLQNSYEHLEAVNNHLKATNFRLEKTHDTLQATLALIEEGIITIDGAGNILNFNKEGAQILKLDMDALVRKNIKGFLGKQSRLMKLVEKGDNAVIEENIVVGNEDHPYLISITPIVNQSTKQVYSVILKLNHSEKTNALVANKYGDTANYSFEDLIGKSKEFTRALALGKRFTSSAENIFLCGESGTGKELFAQAIHNNHRPNGPFIAVNCAAMPSSLIESELFGYEGGSFTGAERSGKAGKIEMANGGTLFLDEIGDMHLDLQAVLLRVLQDKQVTRIGGRRSKKIDFRLIAASNKDLNKMVREGLFREDLYFRLSVLSIKLPSLRQRENDIELLIQYFMKNYCLKANCKIPKISPEALKIIKEYNWPGNVRQLENAMIYALNAKQGCIIESRDLPDYVVLDSSTEPLSEATDTRESVREVRTIKDSEKTLLKVALVNAKYDVIRAAHLLGISKSTLYRKIKEYGIEL